MIIKISSIWLARMNPRKVPCEHVIVKKSITSRKNVTLRCLSNKLNMIIQLK